MISQFVFLPDAGIAINLATVSTVTFDNRIAHIAFMDNDSYLATGSTTDTRALIQALERLTDHRSGDEMRARVSEKVAP